MRLSAFHGRFLAFLAASTLWGPVALAEITYETAKTRRGPASITASLNLDQVSVSAAADGLKSVSLPEFSPLAQPGKPDLVTTGKMIAIPAGFRPILHVTKLVEKEMPNTIVEPYRKKFRCGGKDEYTAPDADLYGSKSVFPAQAVTLEDAGSFQGVRLARLAVYPMRQDFGKKSLRVIQKLEVRVDFEPIQGHPAVTADGQVKEAVALAPTMHRMLSKLVMNADDAVMPAPENQPETMIVIAADTLADSLKPLIAWKSQRGMNVLSYTYSEVGGSREAVFNKIKEIYDNSAVKPAFVLLAGNGTTMPTFRRPTSSGNAASDYPFTLLSGDDVVPDVLIGRIVADNAAEAAIYVRKAIAYEANADVEADWYARGTTIASNEGSNPSDVQYAEMIAGHLTSNTYVAVDGFYQGENTANSTNINRALNDGRSWMTYIGHGSGTSWGSTNGSYGLSQIAQVRNHNKLPVLVDVACDNGSFVNVSRCFGKAWMTHTVDGDLAGLSAYYGGSVSISWHPPAIMSVGAAKYHFEQATHSVGATTLAGQIYLMEEMGVNTETIDNLEWYNLFGDPSMLMRTATPTAYSVKHNFGANGLAVEAVDTDGLGVANLLVSVTPASGGKPIQVGRTDENGTATLPMNGHTSLEGSVLTLSGYNAETRQLSF